MQRPRRTTELVEIPGTATKRLTRSKIPSIAAPSPINGTAKKFTSRSNRTLSRASSQERVNNSALLQVPNSTSQAFGRSSPQKITTPSRSTQVPRTLFTAEKRNGSSSLFPSHSSQPSGPLHNDKRWVHEQVLLLVEFLDSNVEPGEIAGIGADFFNKGSSGGLKTMSIKQFVGIINFFLNKISGNRLVVNTSNHVEDIVSVLQKLNYPHQINKSCLKTPNTQHSFGNVIMILSFLMDLTPTSDEALFNDVDYNGYLFEFQDHEATISSLNESYLRPDSELLAKLMKDSAEGWYLWNEQLNEEFMSCEEKTRDFLIHKMFGLQNLEALKEDNERLKEKLKKLKATKPVVPAEWDQLHKACRHYQEELEEKQKQVDAEENLIKELQMEKSNWLEKVDAMQAEVMKLRTLIKNQKYTVEEFKNLIFKVDHIKYQQKVRQKSVMELSDKNDTQQVKLSRMKKHLIDEVDAFNAQMREIHYFDDLVDDNVNLQISLNPNMKHLSVIIPTLKSLVEKIHKAIKEQEKDQALMQIQIHKIQSRITSDLVPTLQMKQDLMYKKQNSFKEVLTDMEHKIKNHKKHIEKLENSLEEYQKQILLLENTVKEKSKDLEKKTKTVEMLMRKIESEFAKNADERLKSLHQYETLLDEAQSEMEKLSQFLDHVDLQEEHILKYLD